MKMKKTAAAMLCMLMAGGIFTNAGSAPAEAANTKLGKVNYVSCYDLEKEHPYAAKLLKEKYGGELDWRPTTFANRFSDAAVFVLGGEGIDFVPYDEHALPRGITMGIFQPADKYVNPEADAWTRFSDVSDMLSFGGKRYALVTNVTADNVVFYSRKTVKANGLSDPYTLWKKGKWNWETFEKYLTKFTAADSENYGLDGWYFDRALYLSAGTPAVSVKKGKLVSNIESKKLAKAMDFGYGLYEKGLIADKGDFDQDENPALMGSGNELFYIAPIRTIESAPEKWSIKIAPEDLGIAPVPSPKGYKNYMGVKAEGVCILTGADNPKGAAKFAECIVRENFSKDAIAQSDKKAKSNYGWTDGIIKANREINKAARKNPVIDISNGISSDIESTVFYSDYGITAAFGGQKWEESKKMTGDIIALYIDEANKDIAEAIKKKKQ